MRWRHGLQIEALDRLGSSMASRWRSHRSFANGVYEAKKFIALSALRFAPFLKEQKFIALSALRFAPFLKEPALCA